MTSASELTSFLDHFSGGGTVDEDFGLHGKIRHRECSLEELRAALGVLSAAEPLPEELGSLRQMRQLHHVTRVLEGHAPRFRDDPRQQLLLECAQQAHRLIGRAKA
jgi:hypothetical protein